MTDNKAQTTPINAAAQSQLDELGQALLDAVFEDSKFRNPTLNELAKKIKANPGDPDLTREMMEMMGGITGMLNWLADAVEADSKLKVARDHYITARKMAQVL